MINSIFTGDIAGLIYISYLTLLIIDNVKIVT